MNDHRSGRIGDLEDLESTILKSYAHSKKAHCQQYLGGIHRGYPILGRFSKMGHYFAKTKISR